jgi:hypothetical protein
MRRHFKYYRTWPNRLNRILERWDRMVIYHLPFMEYFAPFLLFGLLLLAVVLTLWWGYPILQGLIGHIR